MIKHIVFDIGNVLMSFDPYPYYEGRYQDEAKAKSICRMFSHEAWGKYDQGIYFLEDLRQLFHKEFPECEEVDEVLDHWMEFMMPMQESMQFMKELKEEGYQIILLSNISKDSADYLKRTQPFFSYCHHAVLSYEEKLIKPDERLFQLTLDRYGLQAKDCIFIDDNEKNIEVAKEMGFHGIVFTNIEEVKQKVNAVLHAKDGEYVC